jgi:hypothetical protein
MERVYYLTPSTKSLTQEQFESIMSALKPPAGFSYFTKAVETQNIQACYQLYKKSNPLVCVNYFGEHLVQIKYVPRLTTASFNKLQHCLNEAFRDYL